MKTTILLLVALGLVAVFAEDCNNPLLKRSEVIARYGGSANIVSTATTAGTDIPICDYLKGKKVCVSGAGYTAFSTAYKALKESFVSSGGTKNKARFGNLTSLADVDPTACLKSYLTFVLFVTFGGLGSMGGATVNFADAAPQIKAAVAQMEANPDLAEMKAFFTNLAPILKNVTQDKAKCAKHLMENYIYTTCAASEANYASKVSGTSDSPLLKVKKGYCATVTGNCRNYISSMKIIGMSSVFLNLCAIDDVKKVYDLLINQAFSDSVNTQLNDILKKYTSGSSAGGGLDVDVSDTVGSKIACSNVEAGQNSCNFVCESVFNATGFKQNAFDDLNPSSTSRLLQSNTYQESDDSTLDSPDTATKNEDTTVAAENSIGGGSNNGGGSSAAALAFSAVPLILAVVSML